MSLIKNTSYTALACLLAFSAPFASAFFDKQEGGAVGDTKYNAQRILSCYLVKTSYKGDNEGFFSDAEKSVEASCQDRDGGLMDFSASMAQWDKLRNHAGQSVRVYLSNRKIENAKTEWSLIEIEANQKDSFEPEKLCGPNQGEQLLKDAKVWSRGFRIAAVYDAVRASEKTWELNSFVGFAGDTAWVEKGSVTLGEYCNTSIHKIMEINEPLIFTYVQAQEKPNYVIEAIYRMKR